MNDFLPNKSERTKTSILESLSFWNIWNMSRYFTTETKSPPPPPDLIFFSNFKILSLAGQDKTHHVT